MFDDAHRYMSGIIALSENWQFIDIFNFDEWNSILLQSTHTKFNGFSFITLNYILLKLFFLNPTPGGIVFSAFILNIISNLVSFFTLKKIIQYYIGNKYSLPISTLIMMTPITILWSLVPLKESFVQMNVLLLYWFLIRTNESKHKLHFVNILKLSIPTVFLFTDRFYLVFMCTGIFLISHYSIKYLLFIGPVLMLAAFGFFLKLYGISSKTAMILINNFSGYQDLQLMTIVNKVIFFPYYFMKFIIYPYMPSLYSTTYDGAPILKSLIFTESFILLYAVLFIPGFYFFYKKSKTNHKLRQFIKFTIYFSAVLLVISMGQFRVREAILPFVYTISFYALYTLKRQEIIVIAIFILSSLIWTYKFGSTLI